MSPPGRPTCWWRCSAPSSAPSSACCPASARSTACALLLPLAFALGLPPETALILLAAVYLGCEYGGRISAILLNVPGDAAAVMTTLDGYPLARQGKAGIALSLSAVSSFIGSIIATCGVVLFAPLLAKWAVAFGPAEYFVLMIFAIACLGGMVGDKPVKTLMAALMGLALATVGVDSTTGVYRFTFGSVSLSDGIQFVIVVIGFFSVSEILLMLEKTHSGQKAVKASGRLLFNFKEFCLTFWTMVRSAVAGFVIGTLPGAGATIASAMTYMSEKRMAGDKGRFGDGDLRGLAAPEAANNASACGSLIPMLTLGVPGSGHHRGDDRRTDAVQHHPGPAVVRTAAGRGLGSDRLAVHRQRYPLDHEHPAGRPVLAHAQRAELGAGTDDHGDQHGRRVFGAQHRVRPGADGRSRRVRLPLRKLDFPLSALILGFVLGEMMEDNLRRALSISNGELGILYGSPITLALWG